MVRMRKAVFLVAVISTCATLVLATELPLRWVLTSSDVNQYGTLLANVRGRVQGTTCFQIPMIGSPPRPTSYVTVSLESSGGKVIDVALLKDDLYVAGYSDTDSNGRQRAFLFRDASADAFPNAESNFLTYTGSYKDLEKNSGKDRGSINLSKNTIIRLMNEIHGKPIDNAQLKKQQAEFLLVAIQMIAEATRFKYIEFQVRSNYNRDLVPDKKVYYIVNEWSKISKAIANANPDGTLKDELTVPVARVADIRNDIALLKYVPQQCAALF